MEDYNPDLLTLTNDEGEEYTFELLDTLEEDDVSRSSNVYSSPSSFVRVKRSGL